MPCPTHPPLMDIKNANNLLDLKPLPPPSLLSLRYLNLGGRCSPTTEGGEPQPQ